MEGSYVGNVVLVMNRIIPFLILFMWLLAMSASYKAAIAPVTGTGFARGADRVGQVLVWQVMATVMAVALWRIGRDWNVVKSLRALSVVPLLIAFALALYALGLIAQALLLGV
jgi:hypothetical protein